MRIHPDLVQSAPLVALLNASAEWRVGLAPRCEAVVRWLDRVFFTVRPGECVVVRHDDPAGVRVLLAALAGHPRLLGGRWLAGERVTRPEVRVRRASIRADLVAPLIEGWREGCLPRAPQRTNDPPPRATVHLLRASRRCAATAADHARWREWASAECARGGAMVVVADDRTLRRPPLMPNARVAGPWPPQRGRESGEVRESSREDGEYDPAPAIRSCRLQHGRLLPDRAAARDQYCWPSDSPLVVGPY